MARLSSLKGNVKLPTTWKQEQTIGIRNHLSSACQALFVVSSAIAHQ